MPLPSRQSRLPSTFVPSKPSSFRTAIISLAPPAKCGLISLSAFSAAEHPVHSHAPLRPAGSAASADHHLLDGPSTLSTPCSQGSSPAIASSPPCYHSSTFQCELIPHHLHSIRSTFKRRASVRSANAISNPLLPQVAVCALQDASFGDMLIKHEREALCLREIIPRLHLLSSGDPQGNSRASTGYTAQESPNRYSRPCSEPSRAIRF